MESIIYLNGGFLPASQARIPVYDRGFYYGDGLFETLRAYSGTIFKTELHLNRLARSAESIDLEIPLTHRELEAILYETLCKNQLSDAMMRLTVTRGSGPPGILWSGPYESTLAVDARPYQEPPKEWNRQGVSVWVIPRSAGKTGNLKTRIKSTNYLGQILARKQAQEHQSVEGIMTNDRDEICDGTVSNVFLVHDRKLTTPAVNEYVLPGITRYLVVDLASKTGLKCVEKSILVNEIQKADEVFLTNTGWEILPVTCIDGKPVGQGTPGSVTQTLQNEFRKIVEAEIRK